MSQIHVGERAAGPEEPIPYRPAEGVQVSTTTRGQGGGRTHFLRSRRGELCQLGEEEYFLFTLIDGQPTFSDIQREFRTRFAGDLSPRHFQSFIDELVAGGIIERIEAAPDETEPEEQGPPVQRTPLQRPPLQRTPLQRPPAAEAAGSSPLPKPPPTRAERETVEDAEIAPVEQPPAVRVRRPAIGLRPLFITLAVFATPLRYFAWLLVPAAAIAGLVLFVDAGRIAVTVHALTRDDATIALSQSAVRAGTWARNIQWRSAGGEFSALAARVAAWSHAGGWRHFASPPVAAALVAVLVGLVLPRIAGGVAAAYHGAPRETFRFRLFGWCVPLLAGDRAGIAGLPRKGRAWSHAARLLTRLALFAGGTFLWVAQGDPGRALAVGGLALALFGGWSFLFSATPLWSGDGRAWMAAMFDEPVSDHGRGEGSGLFRVFAVIIGLAAIVGAALPWADPRHHQNMLASAALLLGFAYLAALLWLHLAWASAGPLRPIGGAYARKGPSGLPSFGHPTPGGVEFATAGPVSLDERLYSGRQGWETSRTPINLAIIIGLVIAIAFLPYPYESGGGFSVMPYDRFAVDARVSGEVTEVLVREGDTVQEGQVVGTLADWSQVHSLNTAQAQLEQALANLQNLLISPKPEEVLVAQRQYEQALSRVGYSKSEYERDLALLKTNDVSVKSYESALSTYQQDQAAVAVTKANYELVRVGPTQAQIASARASVHSATEQVSFDKDQLERTRIRAAGPGVVVTPDPQLLMGLYLQTGQTFISIENHRTAHIEVQVPETDIRDIHLGSLVRAKAWGYEHTIWLGKTVLIAPDAQPNATLGNLVRVVAEVPNSEGLLLPIMSGYAKVETVDMPVWVSFSRAIVRFLLIEVWYWIP